MEMQQETNPQGQSRRADDELVERMVERMYPLFLDKLCIELGVTKGDLYRIVGDVLERERNYKLGKRALWAAMITAVVAGVGKVVFDLIKLK